MKRYAVSYFGFGSFKILNKKKLFLFILAKEISYIFRFLRSADSPSLEIPHYVIHLFRIH